MENLKNISLDFSRDTDVMEEIYKWESRFEENIREASEAILSGGRVTTVALSGPSCSGKTTTAGKLEALLSAAGRRVVSISIDDFYLDRDDEADRIHIPDYESPDALDLEMFSAFTTAIHAGNAATAPVYDFKKRLRTGRKEYIPQENDIYIFEGIQAMYPEIYESLGSAHTSRVFINVSSSVTANGVQFEPDEIRLLRRLLRDFRFRASSAEFTFRLWDGVRDNEERRILPGGEGAEIKINSVIPYDVYVMCRGISEILSMVDLYSPQYPAASFLSKKLEGILPYAIPETDVPGDSLLHEFIG